MPSVIHGTLKPEDLLPTFLAVLKEHSPEEHRAVIEDWNIGDNPKTWLEEHWGEVYEVLAELTDTLTELAPDGYYFGSHPGDGSDFGFWHCEEGP